jgi:hypothetical protein
MRTIKEEEVDLSEYQDFSDAYRQLGRQNVARHFATRMLVSSPSWL